MASGKLLVDTHALLWYLAGDQQLSQAAQAMIDDPQVTVFVSAASAWEITTKYRIGKLPRDYSGLAADVDGIIQQNGFTALPISLTHAQRAGALPGPHKDPFDRMLIAQALSEGIPIASNEEIFDTYGTVRIW